MPARAPRAQRHPRGGGDPRHRAVWLRRLAWVPAFAGMTYRVLVRSSLRPSTRQRDVARGLDIQDRVRAHIARDDQPRPVAGDVLPQLAVRARGIVAQIDVIVPPRPGSIVER